MRIEHGLLMILLAANWGVSGSGAELPQAVHANPSTALTTPAELDALSLSMVDEKLALSLAVEAHVQIELLQFAVAELDDAALRQLAQKRLTLHRELFAALDALTSGRAANMLASAAPAGAPADVGSRTAQSKTAETTSASRPADSHVEDAVPSRPAKGPNKGTKRGGLKAAVENATNAAILRVRLDVADEYAELLRNELESDEPEDFDRTYSTLDVVNQMQVVALLRVFERQASQDFAALIHRATGLAESQLDEARQLAQDGDPSAVDPMVAVRRK